MRPTWSLLFLALALTGCHRDAVRDAAPHESVASVPADDNLNAVAWMQTSAEYRANSLQTYRAAIRELDRAIKDRDWDALAPSERANPARGLPPAVVFDVDETVLDNSPYQARLVVAGTEYSEPEWDNWVREQKATAVPGVLEFAKAAQKRGVALFFISNRAVHLKDATIANLRSVGLDIRDDSFLGLGTVVPDCEQQGSDKNCRRQLIGRKYRVLMQFGDQLGDFVELAPNTVANRDTVLEAHRDWIGERWWVLANPTYGSWEPALFDNNYRQPRDARREVKREALRLAK
ncbi:5'-nucleotidase, lipoprotein e(P4) family [Lysobacter xinjiangensis]|uniref:5'-nucleotidase, lipoprotein e(P4) family n=1 Tax=Cognatilysobacter xinjiangensis TaxID=546892 RepID=A0ABQ3C421_9GAMM|nr:HAD family acid phosphatase [Lysobacter xinjiangensis]GGZ64352.1 5'-nucleotidase, lipoprotein e(P4) family [Lysobacter xinjiangensis]